MLSVLAGRILEWMHARKDTGARRVCQRKVLTLSPSADEIAELGRELDLYLAFWALARQTGPAVLETGNEKATGIA